MKPTETQVYSNDRTAPRMRKAKYSEPIITMDLWRRLKQAFPEFKGKSKKELNDLWNDVAETYRQEIVTNPLGTKLGSYTGELKLQYLPFPFKSSNNLGSEEVGEKIDNNNLLTRGKVAKLKWERKNAVRFNRVLQFFAFSGTRELEKLAKQYIDANPEKVRVSRSSQRKIIKYDN